MPKTMRAESRRDSQLQAESVCIARYSLHEIDTYLACNPEVQSLQRGMRKPEQILCMWSADLAAGYYQDGGEAGTMNSMLH